MKRGLRQIPVVVIIIILMGAVTFATAKDDRFIVHHVNGTVLDTKTTLMWAAKDNGTDISWQAAKSYCENYDAGGHRDWRMPTPGNWPVYMMRPGRLRHSARENSKFTWRRSR